MFKAIDYKWLVEQWGKNRSSLFSLFTTLIAIIAIYFLYKYMENEMQLKNDQLQYKDRKIIEMYDQLLINNNLIRQNKILDTVR
ncbi:hypothetical protein [uncultured Mediterranean phage uvMED]|nr:hypothetical protein [uncultured Mediterranean phage uvMED]